MMKKHDTTTVIVLMVHIVILAFVFFVGTAATVTTTRDVPSTLDVSLIAYAEQQASPPSGIVNGAVSGTHTKEARREPIIPSTNRVIRSQLSVDTPVLTTKQIENALLASLSPITSTTLRPHNDDTAILQAAFHGPWRPPSRHEVGDAEVIARVVFARDGAVLHASIESPSGIPSLDASVRAVLQQVLSVAGLSVGTLQNSDGVSIAFSVMQ